MLRDKGKEPSTTVYKQVIEYLRKIRPFMVSRQRAAHIERMEEDGKKLSKVHDLNESQIILAVCAHDLFRDTKPGSLLKMANVWDVETTKEERYLPLLLHGKIASEYLKRRFDIEDKEVLNAVSYHTSGMPTDSKIVKALVVLDTTEHGRNFDGVEELRKIVLQSLDDGYAAVIKNKIGYALLHDLLILEKTVQTWNYLKGLPI